MDFPVRMAEMVMADVGNQPRQQRRKGERPFQRLRRRDQQKIDGTTDGPPTAKAKIKESDLTGLKYFEKLAPLLARLHDAACERDTAGNRERHFDQYGLLILLYLFNPIVPSLRGIQQASELGKVQKKLGCSRVSLGLLSEAATVFDAEWLKEIIAELGAERKPLGRDGRLKQIDQALVRVDGSLKKINQTLVRVDGSLIAALPSIMEASCRKRTDGSGLVNWRSGTAA